MKKTIFLTLLCLLVISCSSGDYGIETRLKNRFSGADVVIIGEVGKIEKFLLLPTAQRADWRVAYVHVEQVLRGRLNSNLGDSFIENDPSWTKVYFPNSWTESWQNCPKFYSGQKGIFALRKVEGWFDLSAYDNNAMTSLDYFDFLPMSESSNVKKFLAVR